MAQYTLTNGLQKRVGSVPQRDHPAENTVAVILTGGRVYPWCLRFWARFGDLRAYMGAVRTFALPNQRVVAILSMPGANAFECEGEAIDRTAVDNVSIDLEGIEGRGGPWGVQHVPGISVPMARSYRVATGTNGVVAITGEVWGWSARATAINATVAVAALPALAFGPIAVPAAGEVHGDARGLLAPQSTWTFNNTDGYIIEYIPPGGVFDG